MKKLTTIISLVLCMSLHAQIKPFAGVECYNNNSILLRDWAGQVEYNQGNLAMIYGLSYRIKKIEFSSFAKTLMNPVKLTAYKPTHSEFTVSADYHLNDFKIKLEHKCIHPLQSYRDNPVKIYGGYTKFGIYWNYKP